VGVLVAAKELSAAMRVPLDGFRVEQWPVDRVPPGAVTDPKMVENKFMKQRLYIGEPFIEAKLSSKGKEFSVPAGYRIFDIPVRDESGGGGYIGPGDRVDVFGYFDKGARINAAKSVKVMENLEVVMIDGVAVVDPEVTSQKKSSTIQLLVKDSQYIVLDTAANLGKLRLALRPPEQASSARAREDEGEDFMAWVKQSESSQVQPPKSVPDTLMQGPAKSNSDGHEMMVISASKSTKYKMVNGYMVAQKEEADADKNSPLGGYQSQSYQPFPASYKTPTPPVAAPTPSATKPAVPASSGSSSQLNPSNTVSSQAGGNNPASDPANSVQPNMTWDPNSGSWQSGGFKATYPNGK
jgi:Flp pilus assembly protein CpaB